MDYEFLPKPLQASLRAQFVDHMRRQLLECENDLLCSFLEQEEIAKSWHEYKEEILKRELEESSEYWAEWLAALYISLARAEPSRCVNADHG